VAVDTRYQDALLTPASSFPAALDPPLVTRRKEKTSTGRRGGMPMVLLFVPCEDSLEQGNQGGILFSIFNFLISKVWRKIQNF
jgi:hypothetical protein